MTNGDFKREISDKILHDRAFDNLKNPNFDGYQCELTNFGKKPGTHKGTNKS